MQKVLDSECENARDEILGANCETRDPSAQTMRHLENCAGCREAHAQLASASPETLAVLVLMRGLTPAASAPEGTPNIKSDEKFEEFLAAEVAKLHEENRKPSVIRLARVQFYGLASKPLYPEYENAPTDLRPPRDGYARPLFHAVDRAAARTICRNFINAHRERFDYYRRLDL